MEFQAWPKIPRLGVVTMTITEKLDGTNAHLVIPEDEGPILAASRSRYITPERDNFGFARWVQENEGMLRRLGPGRHYGEWYGAGIQRRYGLTEKRFALFNVWRYLSEPVPEGVPVSVVPVLYHGPVIGLSDILSHDADLRAQGSRAVPGFMQPEGIVVTVGGNRWKVTDAKQGAEKHVDDPA